MKACALTLLSVFPLLVIAQTSTKQASVYSHVDQMPQYPGGNKALAKVFTDSIGLPGVRWREEEETDYHTHVILTFTVDENGAVSDVKVLHSNDAKLNAAFISAAQKLKFIPAVKDGKPVSVKYVLPIDSEMPPH